MEIIKLKEEKEKEEKEKLLIEERSEIKWKLISNYIKTQNSSLNIMNEIWKYNHDNININDLNNVILNSVISFINFEYQQINKSKEEVKYNKEKIEEQIKELVKYIIESKKINKNEINKKRIF